MDPSTIAEALHTVSQDDLEESVKIDKSPSLTPEEQFQENTESALLPHTIAPKYYSVMDDEGPDEVSVQPPFLPSRLDPEGGSTCAAPATDPSVNLRPCDATEANTNPECLDWHHGERQLMTSYSPPNEEMESGITNFGEVVRRKSSGETQCTGQELKLMDEKVIQDCEEIADKSNDEKPEDQTVELKSIGDVDLREETGVTHSCLKLEERNLASQDLNYVSDNSEEEGIDSKLMDVRPLNCEFTAYDWVKRTSVEDVEEAFVLEHRKLDDQEEVAETIKDSKIATEILQGEDLLQRLQLVQQRQDLAETFQETQKLDESLQWTENLGKEDPDTNQEIQKQEQTEHESGEETSVLTVTEHFERCSIQKTDVISCNEESDLRNYVNLTETSAGEDVCKHLEQDKPGSESTAEQIGIDLLTKDRGLEDKCCKTEGACEEEQTCAEENNDREDDKEEVKEKTYLPLLSPERIDIKGSDTENTDTWMNEDRIPIPLCHRLSAAETYMEKQFQEAFQIKRDLQRAGGVFDLSDDPDILEIPFKTSISLESLPSRDDLVQRGDWHFSEQKMQKEISQEMQRELVLVNLGKIPGGYSKGESRQMRDTKMLFEAFQQDKTEGPTRIRKPQTSLLKSQVYPSVLERTRSLEMFSHKMSPMLRTHSFRIMSSSEKEKHPEMFRSQSPSLRDKARLSPYPKHEKPPRKHKSMDSINVTSSMTSRDRVKNSKEEPLREGSPILKENPFFKLRPALSLQPEVEKDIREAKKREEELRKQRSSLYGETKLFNKEEGKSSAQLKADPKQKTTGKLERVWPPPSKKDSTKAEQQETRVQRAPGHRAALWQRWESGLINGQTPSSNNN